jgi:hypothetical protein
LPVTAITFPKVSLPYFFLIMTSATWTDAPRSSMTKPPEDAAGANIGAAAPAAGAAAGAAAAGALGFSLS